MSDIVLAEWRNRNQKIRYPFADTAGLRALDGRRLDGDLFDDARIHPVGGRVGAYLASASVEALRVTVVIADPVNGITASGSYDLSAVPDNVVLEDVYGRPAGILVSDALRLAALAAAVGTGLEFNADQTEFVASAVVPMPDDGVTGVLLPDGTVSAGDVWLVGTDGIVLTVEDGDIRVDVIGDPHALAKKCKEQGVPIPLPCRLRTLNGIPPDAFGDWHWTPGSNVKQDNIIRIEQENDGVLLIKRIGTVADG